MPAGLVKALSAVVLCLVAAGCGTSAVQTAETPGTPVSDYRAVVVAVPLARGVDRDLARIIEAETVLAIKRSRRWRLVVASSLAAGQKQGLRVEIDLRQEESGGFKAFTNTLTATVALSDIANGERLGGVTVSASGASLEMTGKAIGEQVAEWVVGLP